MREYDRTAIVYPLRRCTPVLKRGPCLPLSPCLPHIHDVYLVLILVLPGERMFL
ncbi:uncharacterized protein LACBIDRAFT_312344 [Laccaria bicolor S238N-H82]|uniref:Predicted protein n=1 Tax=Laccaria bicolor (strain S238N-H82 / ATCC MYA-4686) TaxID=486041 RepID=B0DW00_LACBS|nr:uncharacterized protein LACBIDRAFT_312344 [Laccaria bicolor S238N-H82]EDR01224.1 predicted protein [Laccaria bicolor S238N-H82]|eukprot:XP_001888100.1 predicted protein [Laccaria bicolor S238N-H82]